MSFMYQMISALYQIACLFVQGFTALDKCCCMQRIVAYFSNDKFVIQHFGCQNTVFILDT